MSDVPSVSLSYDLGLRRVSFPLSETLYPLDAIYGAAYLFVDRCWIFLDRVQDKEVLVHLKSKGDADEAALEALAGEYANELLNQVLRIRVGDSTKRIREYTMAKAFFSAPRQTTIDQLLAELDAEELADDPLEIEVPWETDAPAADAPADAPAADTPEPADG